MYGGRGHDHQRVKDHLRYERRVGTSLDKEERGMVPVAPAGQVESSSSALGGEVRGGEERVFIAVSWASTVVVPVRRRVSRHSKWPWAAANINGVSPLYNK
jgi:hypothetical protein